MNIINLFSNGRQFEKGSFLLTSNMFSVFVDGSVDSKNAGNRIVDRN